MLLHKSFLSLVRPTIFCLLLASASVVLGQATSFTYQGRLQDSGSNANGTYDFEFALFDALTGGSQIGSTISRNSIIVTNGTFGATLDFGNQFPGADRFFEIRVRPTGGGAFTTLSPRQQINSTPYSIKSLNAESAVNATNATQLGGVSANQYVLTGDTRLSDARNPLPGSADYIQNTNAPQATSNFNITGGGVIAGSLAVGTPGASARLHVVDTTNVATGYFQNLGTGDAVRGEGSTNGITGGVGVRGTGLLGVFGSTPNDGTGVRGTSSSGIGVLGTSTTGVGIHGTSNGLAGRFDGRVWIQGTTGSILDVLPTGGQNVFLGGGNLTGSELKLSNSGTAHFSIYNSGNSNLTFANTSTNISANTVGSPLMSITSGGNVGIGTTSPSVKLEVNGRALINTSGNNGFRITPSADADIGVLNVTNAANTVNWLTVGSNGQVIMNGGGMVGIGTTSPIAKLHVQGDTRITSTLSVGSSVSVGFWPSGGSFQVCWAGTFLSTCGSSIRYKTNLRDFNSGVTTIKKLHPITFDWKSDGKRDFGLVAEEVEKIEPLLVTYNKDNQVDGVKYDRIGVVLINAVKEQQAQIESQQEQIDYQKAQIKRYEAQARLQRAAFVSQQQQLDALRRFICRSNRRAAVCK